MNDFTKDELNIWQEHLLWCLEVHCLPPEMYELAKKIQSMIDNYCEHLNEDRIFYGDVAVGECKECHMVIL